MSLDSRIGAPNVPTTLYDWSGLRNRRILLAIGLLFVFPGSCIALAVTDADVALVIVVVALGGSLTLIRRWPCPRCGRAFSARPRFPWVSPFTTTCRSCGLPDFTPSAVVAPPPVESEDSPDQSSRPAATPEEVERKRQRRRRMRVGVGFAIPLVYLTVCRMPPGEAVRTREGHTILVLGLTRWTQVTVGGGRQHSLLFGYYTPPDDVATAELLALTRGAVRQTGDSTVRLQSFRGDWWARALGVHISSVRAYRLRSDGSWVEE